jgi:uncharacterized membrane protein
LHDRLAASLTIGACLWVAAIAAAPYAVSSHNPVLVTAGVMVYQGAGLICHQRPERSFHVGGVQLPVCGRCLGLYVSGACGAVIAWFASRRNSIKGARLALAVAAIPTALTVPLEFAGLMHPTNFVRAVSALPLGAAAAWIFVTSLRADSEPRSATYARSPPS